MDRRSGTHKYLQPLMCIFRARKLVSVNVNVRKENKGSRG